MLRYRLRSKRGKLVAELYDTELSDHDRSLRLVLRGMIFFLGFLTAILIAAIFATGA